MPAPVKVRSWGDTWYDVCIKLVTLVGGLLVILGTLAGGISWYSGGIKIGTQVSADELTAKVNGIEATLGKIKDKIDAFPRASDFAAQSSLNDRMGSAISGLGDRLTRDELSQARTDARVDALYGQPVRQPSR